MKFRFALFYAISLYFMPAVYGDFTIKLPREVTLVRYVSGKRYEKEKTETRELKVSLKNGGVELRNLWSYKQNSYYDSGPITRANISIEQAKEMIEKIKENIDSKTYQRLVKENKSTSVFSGGEVSIKFTPAENKRMKPYFTLKVDESEYQVTKSRLSFFSLKLKRLIK